MVKHGRRVERGKKKKKWIRPACPARLPQLPETFHSSCSEPFKLHQPPVPPGGWRFLFQSHPHTCEAISDLYPSPSAQSSPKPFSPHVAPGRPFLTTQLPFLPQEPGLVTLNYIARNPHVSLTGCTNLAPGGESFLTQHSPLKSAGLFLCGSAHCWDEGVHNQIQSILLWHCHPPHFSQSPVNTHLWVCI